MVRFGESQGFECNRIRDNAWRYRDWVVDAFNRDLPYDEFVRQQIAGDVLLPEGPRRPDRHRLPRLRHLGPGRPPARARSRCGRQIAVQDELEDLVAHARAVVPRPDDQLRPLPRPQVRPDLAEGVLPGRGAARRA